MLLSVLILNFGSTLHVFRTVRQAYGSLLGDDDGSNRSFFFRGKFNCSSERSFCFHLHLNRFSSSTNWLQLHRSCRKAAYRTAILFLHGRMGKGRRAVVPACIGRFPIILIPLHIHASISHSRCWQILQSSNHFTFLLFSSGQNSRLVPRGRRQLHGVQEDRGHSRCEDLSVVSIDIFTLEIWPNKIWKLKAVEYMYSSGFPQ